MEPGKLFFAQLNATSEMMTDIFKIVHKCHSNNSLLPIIIWEVAKAMPLKNF